MEKSECIRTVEDDQTIISTIKINLSQEYRMNVRYFWFYNCFYYWTRTDSSVMFSEKPVYKEYEPNKLETNLKIPYLNLTVFVYSNAQCTNPPI